MFHIPESGARYRIRCRRMSRLLLLVGIPKALNWKRPEMRSISFVLAWWPGLLAFY